MKDHQEPYDVSRLGDNIAALRRAAGMMQEMLALRLGLSAQAVSKWERGLTCPDLAMLPTLAIVFGVTIDALFAAGQQDGLLPVEGLPWEADDRLRVAVFEGKSLRLHEVYECPEEGMVLLIRPGHGETCPMGELKKG